jgi:hypothetical protein
MIMVILVPRLRMARTMAQRYKHLPPPQHCLRDILAHDRVAARKPLLVPQPFKNPMRRMALLLVNLAVAFKNGINPRHMRPKLLRYRTFTPAIARRNRKTQHFRDRVPVNAKSPCRFPPAQTFNHHRASDYSSTVNILPAPQCRSAASRRPSRTGTLLRRLHSAADSRFSGTLCLRDLYGRAVLGRARERYS